MSNDYIWKHCTVLHDYMVKDGSFTWSTASRYRVYYLGIQVQSVTELDFEKFDVTHIGGRVHKDVTEPLDEIFYVEQITVRTVHTGIHAVNPARIGTITT